MKKATIDLFTHIFSVLAPPPDMTISQWADEYRRLSSESSAEPGRWRTAKAPYQKEKSWMRFAMYVSKKSSL